MTHTIKLMSGDKVIITEQEFKNLAGKSGLVFIPSTGGMINTASIVYAAPTEQMIVDKSKMTTGFLHDGGAAIRVFGEWVDANSPVDENGRRTVKLDPHYYPETVRDCVATPVEWETLKLLPKQERLEKMLSGSSIIQNRIGGLEQVKKLL